MKSFLLKIIFVSAFAVFFALNANSQQISKPRTGSAILSGTIYDVNGAVIPKAKIVFQNNFNETFSTETNTEGVYSLSLPFNLIGLNSSKTDLPTLKYKIIVDLENRGFQKKIIDDFNFVSPLNGKMIFDIAIDSAETEPCGYSGADCITSEPVELKESEIKVSDKISHKPLEKSSNEPNKKKKN